MEFIKDCLSRNMSLRDIATKYDITVDEVIDKYYQERAKYTEEEIVRVMYNVYYL